jgi:hypothetical protein
MQPVSSCLSACLFTIELISSKRDAQCGTQNLQPQIAKSYAGRVLRIRNVLIDATVIASNSFASCFSATALFGAM